VSTAHGTREAGGAGDAHGARDGIDLDDPALTRFDLVREGARRDGVEIVHYEPRFPVPGTPTERRVERTIALLLGLAGLAGLAFTVVFAVWPYTYELGKSINKLYTPLLGLTLGLALLLLGLGIIVFAKKLLPEEVSVQDRHDGASPRDERRLTGATVLNMVDELGVRRRPLLKGAVAVAGLGLAPAAAVTLGAFVKDPGKALYRTAWADGVRLLREDRTPIKPTDVTPGGLLTVFPDVEGGTTNEHADAPTLLIHLRTVDAQRVTLRKGYEDFNYGNYYAYSKICTHAGCPASLYEASTNLLLCPCHQSQFDVLDHCKPIFGPASRALPQLAITLDAEGYFIAKGDYPVPVGPAFWERDS